MTRVAPIAAAMLLASCVTASNSLPCPATRPHDGDSCTPPPPGYTCLYNVVPGGDCYGTSDECYCGASGWECTRRSRDGALGVDASVPPCGTAPMCWAECWSPP